MTDEGVPEHPERPKGLALTGNSCAGAPALDCRPIRVQAGVSFAQAIDRLSAELRRVSAETQRVSPGFR